MTSPSFREFFTELWGVPPFGWQERLAAQVVGAGWPSTLDLPTGVGKTAAIDVAVWHLAVSAGRAPRRILFVVDRRVVVDAAYERAKALADRLRDADTGTTRGVVADALRRIAGSRGEPLVAVRLRGGVPRERDWAVSPLQPVVAASTVDQVGSRLLFSGYGVSPLRRSMEAALMGTDALVFLDEAHLSEPFRQTLDGLGQLRRNDPGVTRAVALSATPGAAPEDTFCLTASEWSEPALGPRLTAPKRAALELVPDDDGALVDALVRAARGHVASGAGTVLVITNRVAFARRAFTRVAAEDPTVQAFLVTGRARSIDRDIEALRWLPRFRAGRDDDDAPRDPLDAPPAVLVATQCVEAGVDLDADALVTESAALDALRQRFGRLNRRGRLRTAATAPATIVHRRRPKGYIDPVYGEALPRTWDQLSRWATPYRKLRVVDFGSSAMRDRLTQCEDVALLLTPRPDAPILLPSHLDAWEETSAQGQQAAPELFLHGPAAPAEVSVCWRRDLVAAIEGLPSDEIAAWHQFSLDALPPVPEELLPLPVWTVRRWLGDALNGQDEMADVEGQRWTDEEEATRSFRAGVTRGRFAYRLDADGAWVRINHPLAVRPGDLIAVGSDLGGYPSDGPGWAPESDEPVRDVAELALAVSGRDVVLRFTAQDLARSSGFDAFQLDGDARHLIEPLLRPANHDDGHAEPVLAPEVAELAALAVVDPKRRDVIWLDDEAPTRGLLITLRAPDRRSGADVSTEDDAGSFIGTGIRLDNHLTHVEAWADHFALALGSDDEERRALCVAARWHDVGKADLAFQAMLRGERRVSRFDRRPLLAKSDRPWHPGAARRAALPNGWRHEVLSVAIAAGELEAEVPMVRDLALWLIAVHHGRGRLLFPACAPTGAGLGRSPAVPLRADVDGGDPESMLTEHIQRFNRLRVRYGPHRLAFFELLLRSADHVASRFGCGPGGSEVQ
jgi:CRISPR-associated endonuclease/helicase Cas3